MINMVDSCWRVALSAARSSALVATWARCGTVRLESAKLAKRTFDQLALS
jgi:hypothetical protein